LQKKAMLLSTRPEDERKREGDRGAKTPVNESDTDRLSAECHLLNLIAEKRKNDV